MSHRDLAALLRGAHPDALIQRGEALNHAAEQVSDLGSQIWSAAKELQWEGQTADAFRDWVIRFYQDSDNLKTYASLVSSAMTNAGVALRQAQSEMPPAPEIFLEQNADPEYQSIIPTGQGIDEASRQEAIRVISRLGGVYRASATSINGAPEPVFERFDVDPGVVPFPNSPSSPVGSGSPSAWNVTHPVPQPDVPPSRGSFNAVPSPIDAPSQPATGAVIPRVPERDVSDIGTSLDSVATVPNGGAPPVAPSTPPAAVAPERPVPGGGVPQQPVTGPLPGWPAPGQPGRGPGGGAGQVLPVRPSGPPVGPGSQPPPVGRPTSPGMPGGQQAPVGRPPMSGGGTGSGPGGGNPWGRANNYGLLGGKPVPNAKPTVASRIPPGGVIQPGMNAANSRLTPSKGDQPATPRPTYGKATVDGRPATGRGERGRSLPKPTGVIGLPGQGRKNSKKKKKKNESKDDRQQP
ncbi:hypothetical protein ACWC9S_19715 [Streptomyces xiamenensis]